MAGRITRAQMREAARKLRRIDEFLPRLTIRDEHGAKRKMQLRPIQSRILAAKRATLEAGRPARWLHLKYRRGGVTTLLQGLTLHRCATRTGQSGLTLAHNAAATLKIFRMVELFYTELHPAIRPVRASTNRAELDFKRLGSIFYIGTAGSDGLGRGDTLQRVHWSEVAWSLKAQEGLLPGLEEACRKGAIDLETTANGQEGIFYEMYNQAMTGYSAWTPLFFPWFIDPELALPVPDGVRIVPDEPHEPLPGENPIGPEFCDGESELVEMALLDYGVHITPEQLLWRRDKWATTQPNTDLFHQEYPETWQGAFVASADLFFPQAHLREGQMACRPPQHVEDGGRFCAWSEPRPGVEYVAAADTSLGVSGGDASCLVIAERRSGRQVARWHGWEAPHIFGGVVIPKYCQRYNRCEVAIERNNHGHAVIVAAEQAGYRRLWRHPDHQGRKGRDENLVGWNTTGFTRDTMLDNLRAAMQDGDLDVPDPMFWREAFTFSRAQGKRERYEASKGKRDDVVMANAILLEVRRLTPSGLVRVR